MLVIGAGARRFRSLVGGFDLLELDPDILNAVQHSIAHALGDFQGVTLVVTKANAPFRSGFLTF